jgi:hypothetical protein
VKLTIQLHLLHTSRMVELYLHCPLRSHGVVRLEVLLPVLCACVQLWEQGSVRAANVSHRLDGLFKKHNCLKDTDRATPLWRVLSPLPDMRGGVVPGEHYKRAFPC